MLNSPLALLISIAVILILTRFKVPIALSVLAGCILLIIFVIRINDIPQLLLKTVTNEQTWQLLIVVPCTIAFGSLMEQKGLLTRLAATLEGVGPRLAIHVLPAVIGLVPMPAGALVAATAVKGLGDKLQLAPEKIAFINYWFRHIWEISIPVYPAVILVSTILAVPLSKVVEILFPMTVLIVVLGTVVSYRMLRKTPHEKRKIEDSVKNYIFGFLKVAWPILLLIILIFAKVEAWIAFPVTLVLIIIQQKIKWSEMKIALKRAFDPLIILLLLAVMLFQTTAKNSDAASMLVSNMQSIGLPSVLILVGIPLLIGLATGYGPAVVGIALPLLSPYIISGSVIHIGALLVACVSGMMGQLLSPAHLCFCLSVEYFHTTLSKVYRYTVPLCLTIEIVALLVYFVAR